MRNLNMTMDAGNKKVILGMSGGVDSTASALLLKKQGYEVIGLFFDVFGKGEETASGAREAADKLDIPLIYRDISKEFSGKVISYFYNEYACGRTPNPCVMCNKQIKFRVLLEEADRLGAEYIATGHYACTKKDENTGDILIQRAANEKKDQSYVLWKLGQRELRRILFPLNRFTSKEEIREMLRQEGFSNAETRDSQEICFIENDDYVAFLTKQMGMKEIPGDFVDKNGMVLGHHQGIIRYTIGQRKGLGITFGKPVFVTQIDAENNRIVLGDNADLFQKTVISMNNNFCGSMDVFDRPLTGKIRYGASLAVCKIRALPEGRIETEFEEPQRAPTPGQSIVWYLDDLLVGGGMIE